MRHARPSYSRPGLRARGDHGIEAVHMLAGLAVTAEPTVVAAGLTRDGIEGIWDGVIATTGMSDGLDAEALAGIGIDADAVRHATDRNSGAVRSVASAAGSFLPVPVVSPSRRT